MDESGAQTSSPGVDLALVAVDGKRWLSEDSKMRCEAGVGVGRWVSGNVMSDST